MCEVVHDASCGYRRDACITYSDVLYNLRGFYDYMWDDIPAVNHSPLQSFNTLEQPMDWAPEEHHQYDHQHTCAQYLPSIRA
jgi:hypothetical protein